MKKRTQRLIDNPLVKDLQTISFLAGYKELYQEISTRDFRLPADCETVFGRLETCINQGEPVGFGFHIDANWQRALLLKKQTNNLGYGCKIQKRYSVPAKTKGKIIWKKYKGLSWAANGSPDYTNVYIEINKGNALVHQER